MRFPKTLRILSLLLISGIGLSACQTTETSRGHQQAIEKTWDRGWTRIGANQLIGGEEIIAATWKALPVISQKIIPNTKLPAIVYLHGCAGFSGTWVYLSNVTVPLGYAFFAPDSFQREGRDFDCGRQVSTGTTALRIEEARYAHQKLSALPWIDTSRIILIGHSEGGLAVSEYSGGEFAGYVIMGYGCHVGAIDVPQSKPVLALIGENDRVQSGGSSTCSVVARPTPSRSLRVTGAEHVVAGIPEADAALRDFLISFLGPGQKHHAQR